MNQPYKTQGARVYGEGTSYNCTNNITANELCNKLNQLTQTQKTTKNTTQQLETITKKLTQIQKTLNTIEQQLTKLQ